MQAPASPIKTNSKPNGIYIHHAPTTTTTTTAPIYLSQSPNSPPLSIQHSLQRLCPHPKHSPVMAFSLLGTQSVGFPHWQQKYGMAKPNKMSAVFWKKSDSDGILCVLCVCVCGLTDGQTGEDKWGGRIGRTMEWL